MWSLIMRNTLTTRLTAAAAVVAALAGGVALAGGALAGGSDLATPGFAADRPVVASVAPAPAEVSPAVTTRDWQEVAGSIRRRR
jgi:hypothetical protein